MRIALLIVALVLAFHTTVRAAQPPGAISQLRLVSAVSHRDVLVLTAVHNGVFGEPDGPGLVTVWVNGVSAAVPPGAQTFRVAVPGWALEGSSDPSHYLTITTYQARQDGRGYHDTFYFSRAEVDAVRGH